MSPLKVNALVESICEGTSVENRRLLLACVLGAAIATLVTLPSAPVVEGGLRDVFMQNAADLRNTLYQVNEVAPFDVDRAVEYGFQLFQRRYQLVHTCCIDELLGDAPFSGTLSKVMPEHATCGIDRYKITQAVNFIRADAEAAMTA